MLSRQNAARQNMVSKITKEELNEKALFWNPEPVLIEDKGYQLLLDVDAFNNHMQWNVKWFDKYDGLEHCVEFADFASARDYFLEEINETN